MSAKLRASACRGLMAYLMSLGMTLTLLGVTGLLQQGWLAAWTLLVLTGCLTLASLHRKAALAAGGVALIAGAIWLPVGGAGTITEVFRALMLHMSGLTTALPMVATEFALLGCVLTLAASWFVTQRSAGAYPALILLVLIAALLWLGNLADSLICLLPAAFVCVTLLLRAGDEHTSTARVLPLAAVVTAIAFGAAATGGMVSPPLKKAADSLRQRIYDTFFYTQPRDVFTLASEGYYPQGLGQLGGPATPREEPVMAVITPRKTYLRGVVKNIYTGRTWLEDIGGRRYLWTAPRFEELRTTAFDQNLPTLGETVESTLLSPRLMQVRMLRDSASTMFVPQRLRTLTAEDRLTPYFNLSSEVFATSNLQPGDVWTVEAPLFTSQDSGIRQLVEAAAAAEDPNWATVCDRYLQLHEQIDQRVYEMATQATAGISSPYDQAIALERFLASNFAYNLDVPLQSPNHDFVSSFLIEGKEGYCTYFASAMTVMCRMAGLPARYVEGYVAYPDGEGLAVVTGKEGHAWTEVYFRGFGWVTFDATPISVEYPDVPPEASENSDSAPEDDEEQPPEPEETPTPTPPPADMPTPTPEPESGPESPEPTPQQGEAPGQSEQDGPEPPSGNPWGWLLALMILLALAARIILVQPDVQAKMRQTEFARWLVYTQASYDALRSHGFIRDAAETPAAFAARMDEQRRLPLSLEPFAAAQNLMFYGHAAPYEEETAQARRTYAALYRTLPLWRKLHFQLRRICLPARLSDITCK